MQHLDNTALIVVILSYLVFKCMLFAFMALNGYYFQQRELDLWPEVLNVLG